MKYVVTVTDYEDGAHRVALEGIYNNHEGLLALNDAKAKKYYYPELEEFCTDCESVLSECVCEY